MTPPDAPAVWARVLSVATVDTRPLRRHRDFRLLWIGQAIAFMGSMVTAVAVPFQVYQLTHSTLAVGALELVAFLPLVSLGLVGGAYADAHDRRRLVLLCGAGMMLTAALLAGNSLLSHPLLGLIFAVELLRNAVYAMQRPALDALLPRLVAREELAAAGALNSLRGTVGMILGPAIGGLMIAGLGLPITYAVEIAAFGVSLLTLWLMRAVPPPTGAEPLSPALIFLALAGGADMISGIFRMVVWNQTIPDHLRGRLAGIELISYTSGPTLGNFEAGAVAAAFGVTASILSGGVLCVVGAVACALLLPRFRGYDARR